MDYLGIITVKYLFTFFIVLAFIGIAAALWYVPASKVAVTPDQKQALDSLSFQAYLTSNYSFSTDTDLDGLSDAKEIIFGSDPVRNDTDGDNFLDGQEVSAGYDPLIAGQAKISERKDPTLSVQYFSWAAQRTGSPNPGLESSNIEAFIKEKRLDKFTLPSILEYDIRFTNDDPQKIADYLRLLDALTLPEEGSPYLAFAGQLVRNSGAASLTGVLRTLDGQLAQIQNAPVPPLLTDLHRRYMGIWKELHGIFNDLTRAQQDPVLIYLDQKKGEWLVQQVNEAQTLRAQVIAKLKLLPFNDTQAQTTN